MGLKVWLPLNGNFKNNGTYKTSITTASGNEFVTDGKIGNKAFKLTALQTVLTTPSCMTGAKEVSYAYWVKVNTAWSANWLDGIRWFSVDGTSTSTERQEFYTNCTLIGTWYSGGSISGRAFTPGVWTHIAATINYSTGEAKFYINGVLQGTATTVNTAYYCRGDFYIGDNGVDICQNDVRIYDHCLSDTEVRELSKGLVAHYKLDDIASGRVKDSSGYSYNATIVGTPTTVTGSPRYSCAAGFNGTDATINCGRAYYIQQAPALSFNAWVKADNWSSSTLRYYVSCQEAGGFLLQSQADNTVRARVHAYTASDLSTQAYVDATYAQTVAGWHMLTGVYTTSSMKLYIDGVLKTTTTTTTYGAHFYTSANTYIAAESAGTSPSNLTACSVSDVRIYYTALSDADVKDLYQTGMKADAAGRLHAYELSEGGKEAFYKTGDVSAHTFSESNSGLKIKNQEIDANQFIEY